MTTTIHQLYCTDCTYGTSYFHRKTGAEKDGAVGISVRAASLPPKMCEECFEKIQPYTFYRPPADIADEDLEKHTADSLPRRLAYYGSLKGLRVVVQAVYRTTDAKGRIGSFFSHVLVSEIENAEVPWSAVDCLKLWGCQHWRGAETGTGQLAFNLAELSSLDEFRNSPDSPINESVLIGFLKDEPPALTTTTGGSPAASPLTESESRTGPPPPPASRFAVGRNQPAAVSSDRPVSPLSRPFLVPERWKRIPPADRQQILIDTLQGFLELDFQRHQSVLLGIEPEMAALLFFGVASLLPKTGIAERLSFSTFESHQFRPSTDLAATCCHNREQTELPSEAYQLRGFGINTFQDFKDRNRRYPWRSGPKQKQYARVMVELLVAKGCDAVRELTARFEQVGAVEPADLEAVIRAYQLFSLLDDRRGRTDWAGELKKLARGKPQSYFRQACAAKFAGASAVPDDPTRVAQILKQLCGGRDEPSAEICLAIHNLVQRLLDRQADQQIADLINGPGVQPRHKTSIVAAYLERHQRVPPGCESTVSENESGPQQLLSDQLDQTARPLRDGSLESADTKPESKVTVIRELMKAQFEKLNSRFPLPVLLSLAIVLTVGIVAFVVVAKRLGFSQASVLQELQALEEPAQIERFHAVVGDNERFASLLDDADKDGVKTLVRSLTAELAADEVRGVSFQNQAMWLSLLPDDEAASFWLMLSPQVRKQHLFDFDESRLVVVLNACKDAAIDSLLAELDADEKERLSARLKDLPGLSADTRKRLHAVIEPSKTPTAKEPAPVAKEKSTVPADDKTSELVASFLKLTPEQILEFNIQDLSKPVLTSLAMEIPNGGKWDAFVSKLLPEQLVHVLQVLSEKGLQNRIGVLAPVRFERLSPKNLAAAARVIKAETLAVLLPKLNDGQLAALPDDALSELDSAQLHALLDKFAAERLQIVFAKLGAESWHRLDEKLRSRLKDKLGLDDYQELARNYGPRREEPLVLAPKTGEALFDDIRGVVSYQELPPLPSRGDDPGSSVTLELKTPVEELNLRGWRDLTKHIEEAHPGSTLWPSIEFSDDERKSLVVSFGSRNNPRATVSLCTFSVNETRKVTFQWKSSDDPLIQEVQNSLRWCVLETKAKDGHYQAVALRKPIEKVVTLNQGSAEISQHFFPRTSQQGDWNDVFRDSIVCRSGTLESKEQPDIRFGDEKAWTTLLRAHSIPELVKPPAKSVSLVIQASKIVLAPEPPLKELEKQLPKLPDLQNDPDLKFYRDAQKLMNPKDNSNDFNAKYKTYVDVCKNLGRQSQELPTLFQGTKPKTKEEQKFVDDYEIAYSSVNDKLVSLRMLKGQEYDRKKVEREEIGKQIAALKDALYQELKLHTVLYRIVDGKRDETGKLVEGIVVKALISEPTQVDSNAK